MPPVLRHLRPVLLLTVALLALGGIAPVSPALAEPAAEPASEPQPVAADALPTVQINGVVWDQVIVGQTVYAAGSFSYARPAGASLGQSETSRSNLLAYDITTGELEDWAPSTNGAVSSIEASADGSTIYLGGQFTKLNGQNTYRVGAVSATTGNRIPMRVGTNSAVQAVELSADGSTLYIGGAFTQVNSYYRPRAAAIDLASGTVTDFAPSVADYTVRTIAAATDGSAVAIGGSFTSVSGSSNPGFGLAILEPDGTLRRNNVNTVVRNATRVAGIMSLEADAQGLYGTAYSQSRTYGSIEGMFRADWVTGELDLLADCHGDSYDVLPASDMIYISSHTHDCSNIGGMPDSSNYYHGVAFTNAATGTVLTNRVPGYTNHAGRPAPSLLTFYPQFTAGRATGTKQATWTVEGNADYVVYGGEFLTVNGTSQQGLVRFARHEVSTNAEGPMIKGGAYAITARPSDDGADGVNVISFLTNRDRDDRTLTYKVYRDSTDSEPVSVQTIAADFWAPQQTSVTDTVRPGSTHTYRVVVSDPWGNSTQSDWVSVTANGELEPEPEPDPGQPEPDPGQPDPGQPEPDEAVLLSDAFDRETTRGWGTADTGGAWSVEWGTPRLSTADSFGKIAMTGPGSSTSVSSSVMESTSTESLLDMAFDAMPSGNGAYVTYRARSNASGAYEAEIRLAPGGTVSMTVSKTVAGTRTVLGAGVLEGTYEVGQPLHLRMVVDGAESTTLRAKLWTGDGEPEAWQVDTVDDDAALSEPGSLGFRTYMSASGGQDPVTVLIGSLSVRRFD